MGAWKKCVLFAGKPHAHKIPHFGGGGGILGLGGGGSADFIFMGASLDRIFKSQIAARYAAFWHAVPKLHWLLSFSAPKPQRFHKARSPRAQDPDKHSSW